MATTVSAALADLLTGTSTVMELLPGGVWTRAILRNDNDPALPPTPGSTPGAFDDAGRIKRCVSIVAATGVADALGHPDSYFMFPQLFVRCLPLESEKAKASEVLRRMITTLKHVVLTGPRGEGYVVAIASQTDAVDDTVIAPAVVLGLGLKIQSVWKD